jgi:hypothetical protein
MLVQVVKTRGALSRNAGPAIQGRDYKERGGTVTQLALCAGVHSAAHSSAGFAGSVAGKG